VYLDVRNYSYPVVSCGYHHMSILNVWGRRMPGGKIWFGGPYTLLLDPLKYQPEYAVLVTSLRSES
jgi:hypothetical protein